MRTSLLLVALAFTLLDHQSAAQSNRDQNAPPSHSDAVVRTTTRLVVLDVVATDDKGNPIRNLEQQDFTILENGEPQKISDFSYHQPGSAPEVAAKAPSGNIVSNTPQFGNHSCLNVILLDAINTDFSSSAYAQEMLAKYLGSSPTIQPTAVYALEGNLKMLHDFTTDAKVLKEVVAGYRRQGPTHIPTVDAAASPFERRGSFQPSGMGRISAFYGMTFLAQSLAAYPGRKNLIWISEGFPLNLFPDAMMGDNLMAIEDYSPVVAKIADELMESQVALYPISASGVSQVSNFGATTAMSSMAERTGGKTFFNRNDIDLGVRTSIDDGSSYYTLEYYPKNKTWDNKFRHISVKVTRPGVKLHYRDGYYAQDPRFRFGDNTLSHSFSDAMSLNAPSSSAVRFQAAVVPAAQNKIGVNIAIDAHTLSFQHGGDGLEHAELNCVVWAYPHKGDPIRVEGNTISAAVEPRVYQQMLGSYFPCRRELDLKPGQYTLRLGVLDRKTNFIGTLSTPVTVH